MMRRSYSRVLLAGLGSFACAISAFGLGGDASKGGQVFEACAACHAPDQPARTGPDLRGVYGRKAASVPGFRYSRAMKTANIVWNDEKLNEFLADPQNAVPGNAMPYPGLPDEDQRRDVIAYLKTLEQAAP
jgi:cytochrome c